MEYHLKTNDETMDLEMEKLTGSAARVTWKDKVYEISSVRCGQNIIMTVDGRQVSALVEKNPEGKTVILNGRHYIIQDLDEMAKGAGRKKAGLSGTQSDIVTPPMPAIVIQVPVAIGDVVSEGDTVVVVSAMKMETSLKAPHGGTVTQISVGEGDKVMPGDVLVDIEKEIKKEKDE